MKNSLPGGPVVWLGPFAFLAIVAAIIHRNWDRLPSSFPVHWGVSGPDRWTTTTPAHIYGLLATGAALCALLLLMGVASTRSRVRPTAGPALLILLGANYLLALGMGLMPLSVLYPINVGGIMLVLAGLLIAATILFSIRAARMPSSETGPSDSADGWVWGFIYYNPGDPDLIIQRRSGLGYTFNMARPAAWLFIAGFLLVPFLLNQLWK